MSPTVSTARRTPGTAAGPAVLHSRFMLRVAGLPADTVTALRTPDVADWAARTVAEEERLHRLGARLSDPLSEVVGATEDTALRRRLLALRRQVFNNRLPGDFAAARALAADIGGVTGDDLVGWLDARRRWEELRSAGDRLLADALERTRAALRDLARDDRLRRGLLLASPTLEERLDRYAEARVTGKRARKMERSLLAYLYRTACKTSPFSTLTAVALGTFRTSDDDLGRPSTGPHVTDDWTGHPRLNVVALARLAELVAADPRRRADLPVALASGWKLDDDRIRYVRRAVTAGDDSATVSFDAAQDRLFFLRRQGALDGMLELLREAGGTLRYGDLARWLADTTGATEEESGDYLDALHQLGALHLPRLDADLARRLTRTSRATEEAARYLEALHQLGMLQLPGLDTDVHGGDPLRAFQRSLHRLDRPWAEDLAARLDGPVDALARYPDADVPTRRALLRELRTELLAVQRDLGAAQPTLPQTLVYEDVSAGTTTADPGPWTALAHGPLRAVGRMLPAFDVALPQRLTLKGFFLARYGAGGRCGDLLRLVHDFHEDIFHQYLQFTAAKDDYLPDGSHAPEENWLGLDEITAVDRARAAFTQAMRAHWQALPEGAEELVIDDDTVHRVADELAGAAPWYQPQSHFVQPVRREGAPLAVLNDSFGGLCFPFTRFTHCFDQEHGPGLTDALRAELRGLLPPGAVFAEVTAGAATTNLNLHGRLTDYEIVCPGEHSTAPEEARLYLDDLEALHDPDSNRLLLRSRRLDREVVPVYLGYLVPMVLPEIPRTLLLFSPTSRATLDVWRGVPPGPEEDGVTCRPRVRHHGLVLQRRSWTAADGALPLPSGGTADVDAARYLAWHRWRTRFGLPARVFATVYEERPEGAESADGAGGGAQPAWFGGSKPQYVDFESPLSLLALEGLLVGKKARTVFEEMLPGENELLVTSDRGHHVAEFAVEMLPTPAATPGEDPVP